MPLDSNEWNNPKLNAPHAEENKIQIKKIK